MNNKNQRKFERKDSLNILDYVVLNEKDDPVSNGMGRTLNISKKGLLLETHSPLAKGQTLLITVGLEEDVIELKGQVNHVESLSKKKYSSGIEFKKIDKKDERVFEKFLKALNAQDGK